MKRLISVLLIALILLAGCKRAEDDVVNQNLVNDGVETSPVVSWPQTENQPEKDPAPEPKPETKPETKPEVKPEPKPEANPTPEAEQNTEPEVLRYSGGYLDIFCFTVNFKSTAQLKIPENKLISTLDEYNQYRKEYKSFYKSTLYRYYDDKFDEKLKNLNIDDRYFGKRDLLIYVFPISSKLTDMYPSEFYVDGSIKMKLAEYWYDEAYYGYNYGVVVIGIDKWTLNKIGDVKVEYTNTGKEYMSVYTKTDNRYYLSSVPDNSIDVITNANQFRRYMIQRHGEQNGTFFGFDSAQFDDEYFKKNIIAVNNKATKSHTHVFAVDSNGVLYVSNYMDSGTGINACIIDDGHETSGTAVFMQIEREKLKNTELSWQVVKGTYPEPDDNNYNGGSVVIKGVGGHNDAGYLVVAYGLYNRSNEPIKFEDMFSTAVIQKGVKLKENRAAINNLKSYGSDFQGEVIQGGEGHYIYVPYETTDFSSDFVVEVREKATNRLVTSYKYPPNKK